MVKESTITSKEFCNDEVDFKGIRVVASDMDGTLLGGDHHLGQPVREALIDLHADTSVSLILATGRCRSSALNKIASESDAWKPTGGVFLNGAVVYGPKGLVYENCFSFEEIETVVSAFENELDRIVVMLCVNDTIHSPQVCEISTFLHRDYADPYPLSHGSYESMLDHIRKNKVGVHMISIGTIDCRFTEREAFERVTRIMETLGNADEYSVVTPINRLVTILPRKTSKGTGLLALCNHLGICPSEVAAVGDANNDIDMLKIAGIPVAMGNAKEELKKHAKYIVNPNNHPELPGVAQLLRWIIKSHSESP